MQFENEAGSEQPLYEHLRRSFNYTLERIGPHGLPLIGRADWNDCLNLNCFSDTPGQSFQTTTNKEGKVAESVFIAGLFVLASKELAAIAIKRGLPDEAKYYLAEAAKMEKVIYQHGWDGEWFIRAYNDFGQPIGSKVCKEGKIFIESQGMCIMAGVGLDDGKAKLTLESVNKHLATKHGIVLQQPAFTKYYIEMGEISSYPPGYKENAGIFCHNNPWIIIAETMVGNGNRAFDYYTRINPSARENIGDLHRCEPYVYAQMIAGKDAPTHGEAKNSWLTGTAAWNYFTITQWILGIRTGFDGLIVDPVIPAKWKGFTVTRKFRGNTYVIEVKNPNGQQRGVKKLLVDGKEIAGNVLPACAPRKPNPSAWWRCWKARVINVAIGHIDFRAQSSRGLEQSKTLREDRGPLANAPASWSAAALSRFFDGKNIHALFMSSSIRSVFKPAIVAAILFTSYLAAAEVRAWRAWATASLGSAARPASNAYPARLGQWLGTNYDVRNFGVSATTVLHRGDYPYIGRPAYTNALEFKADIVVIDFGANDSKHPNDGSLDATNAVNNWQHKADFIGDYKEMIAAFREANPAAKIFICYPTPDFPGRWGINEKTIRDEMIPMIRTVADEAGAGVIDLHSALAGKADLFPDTVHPNDEAHNSWRRKFSAR